VTTHRASLYTRFLRPLVLALAVVVACSPFIEREPKMPKRFVGPLAPLADSVVSATRPSYCAPVAGRPDLGMRDGCVRRAADTTVWVNWSKGGRVGMVVRQWTVSDLEARLRAATDWEGRLGARMGRPTECATNPADGEREVRWLAEGPDKITVVLIVADTNPAAGVPPHLALAWVLGIEGCGQPLNQPGFR
jgi:hypothetical protein